MRRHEFGRVQHSQDRVLVLYMGVHAFDSSLGVGWQEVLIWYPMGWARFMEMIIVGSEAQHELPNIRDTRGPCCQWATYYLPDTYIDYNICSIVDPMVEHT